MEDGKLLDDFIQKNQKDRTLLEKLRDAFRLLISKLTGADKRMAQTAEGKLTAALEAAAKQAERLQTQSADGTMSETRESLKGKYWRPDLNKAEWDLLNRHMEQEIGDKAHSLDEATQWTYVAEKGNQVFAIYGVGDGTEATPLYAVGGDQARMFYERLVQKMEGSENEINGNGENASQWIDSIWRNKGYGRNDSNSFGQKGINAKGTDQLHGGASERNAQGTAGTGNQNGKVNNRYSLKSVPAVQPESNDWRPGATFAEVKAAHPTLFELAADEANTRNPTQISGTVKSYRKIYDALEAEGFDGTILDASSGLGYGTRAGREEYGFHVDDIEPFPDSKYRPNYTDYSALDKTYDVIISNAVLNVIPQDLRDAMVVKIGEMLNPGGRAFINVRGTDVKNAGSKVAINDDLMEYFISNTGSYQKGFTSKELVSYLRDALGNGFTVEPTRKFGAVSAIVTRNEARFSLKSPVEETKDLIAVHNVSEQGLLGALELGGLPSPSIAITKADMGHTKYGDISLVFSKDTVDPQLFRSNKVYGSDAWTPTAPTVEYPVNSKKLFSVERDLHRLAGSTDVAGGIFGNSSVLRSMGLDDTSTKSAAELAEAISQTDTGRAAYLADQGETLEPVKMAKTWDKYGNSTLQKVVDQIGAQRLAEIDANLELGQTMEEALGADADTIRSILRDYYKNSGEEFLKKMAVRNKWSAEEINQRRQARIDTAMERNVTNFTIEDVVRHAWQMYEDGGVTKGEIDRLATSEALRSAVNDSDVKAWAEGKLEGLLGQPGIYNGKDRYTSSGNSRSFKQLHYEYTLENIVKAMKDTQEARGEGMWGASGGSLMAVATPEYQSLEEIRADKGRLRAESHEEYTAEKEKLTGEIGEVIDRIRKLNKPHSDNSFEEMDIIGSLMMEAAKGKHTTAAIRRVFQDSGYSLSTGIIDNIKALYQEAAQTPTEYFEAKPQRSVGFDEVLAAVVPDNASAKLTAALEQNGVSVIPYKAGDAADRLGKVNSVENAKFSMKGTTIDKEYAALMKENQMLRERLDYWKGQTKRTQEITIDKKSVEKTAKRLLRTYESDLELSEVQGKLQSIYNAIAQDSGARGAEKDRSGGVWCIPGPAAFRVRFSTE